MRGIVALVASLAVLSLAACADDPVRPELSPEDDVLSSLAPGGDAFTNAPPRHVIQFQRSAPADLDERVEALGGTVVLNHPVGIAIVSGLDDDAASALGHQVKARHVVEEIQFRLVEPAAISALSAVSAEPTSTEDPTQAILYAEQWNMRQVKADVAWAAGRVGSEAVTVAILDTGIDYMLPDLEGRVDLSRSVSFVPTDDFYNELFNPGRHPSADLHYHGTNVATQVASNAWAFAGVTSRTTLMSVKVCSFLGGCPGVTEGFLHAVDHGADVINLSLGGWFRKSAFPGQVSIYNALLNYAAEAGVTVVVAAGNDSIDLDRNRDVPIREGGVIVDRIHVPSFFSVFCDARHVICVSATRADDVPATYTNYGRSAIDVAAPGGGSGDWVYSLCPQTSLMDLLDPTFPPCFAGLFVLGVAGTSQATPHVSGLAAMVIEDVGRAPARVRTQIRNSADAVGRNRGNTPFFGMGRINVAATLGVD